jgi:hypothetical protein
LQPIIGSVDWAALTSVELLIARNARAIHHSRKISAGQQMHGQERIGGAARRIAGGWHLLPRSAALAAGNAGLRVGPRPACSQRTESFYGRPEELDLSRDLSPFLRRFFVPFLRAPFLRVSSFSASSAVGR